MSERGNTLQECAEMLEMTQWANEFTWHEIENLARYLYISRVEKGAILFNEGSLHADMYLIVEGSVTVVKEDVSSQGKLLSVIKKGKVIGEMALFDGQPRSAKVIAKDDTTMLVLSRDNLDRLISDMPKLASKLLLKLGALISQKLRMTSGMLVDYI